MSDSKKQEPQPASGNEWAFRRYDTLHRYLIYENQAFWTRTQVFIVTDTALFGLVVTMISRGGHLRPTAAPIAVLAVMGIIITELWRRLVKTGSDYCILWGSYLAQLELDAFGKYAIVHDQAVNEEYSIFAAVRFATAMFLFTWGGVLIVSLSVLAYAFAKHLH